MSDPIQPGDLVQVDSPYHAKRVTWYKANEPITSISQIDAACKLGQLQHTQRVDSLTPFVLVDHGIAEIEIDRNMFYNVAFPGAYTHKRYAIVGLFADHGYLVFWESLPASLQLKHATQEENK